MTVRVPAIQRMRETDVKLLLELPEALKRRTFFDGLGVDVWTEITQVFLFSVHLEVAGRHATYLSCSKIDQNCLETSRK